MKNILEINGLTKSYARKIIGRFGKEELEVTNVIDDLDMKLPKACINFLIGGNGSGKTTLFNLIQNYIPKDKGNVFLLNNDQKKNLSNISPYQMNNLGIERMFQNRLVFKNMSILDNMLVSASQQIVNPWKILLTKKKVSKMEIELELKAKNIWEELLEENNFLYQKRGDLAGTLSYGQQRILALCCLLMDSSNLVLLDEPTSGVNPIVIQQISSILKKLKSKGVTMFIVEHNWEFVKENADYIFYLTNGKIGASGLKKDMIENTLINEYINA